MKRFLSALLCAVLLLGLLPSASAAPGITTAKCSVDKTTAYVGDTITWSVYGQDGVGPYSYIYHVMRNGKAYLLDHVFHPGETSRSFKPYEPGTYYPFITILVEKPFSTYEFDGPATVVSLRPASKITKVEALGGTSLKITWNEIPGADGYYVGRSASLNSGYDLIKTTTAASFTDTSLKPGMRYFYRMCGYITADGMKMMSSEISDAVTGVPLAKSAITKTSSVSTSQIRLTWEKVPGADGYQVFRSKSKTGTYTAIRKISDTSMIVTGMEPGNTYYFKVRAYKKLYTTTYFGPMSGYRSGRTLTK